MLSNCFLIGQQLIVHTEWLSFWILQFLFSVSFPKPQTVDYGCWRRFSSVPWVAEALGPVGHRPTIFASGWAPKVKCLWVPHQFLCFAPSVNWRKDEDSFAISNLCNVDLSSPVGPTRCRCAKFTCLLGLLCKHRLQSVSEIGGAQSGWAEWNLDRSGQTLHQKGVWGKVWNYTTCDKWNFASKSWRISNAKCFDYEWFSWLFSCPQEL
jgi:hypothetical protein